MDSAALLAEIASEVRACRLCRLCEGRAHAVPGEGNPHARLMFIGEGPGEQEDRTGRPFVGPAGQLLDRLLAGIGLSRDEVFIANVVKCRPPGNRTPSDDETQACLDWLMAQIAVVQPEIIALLGGTALNRLLDPEARISRVRGRTFHKDGLLFIPLFHPAAVLRRAEWLPLMEEDFRTLRRMLDGAHPTSQQSVESPPPAAEPAQPAELTLF